MTALQWIVKEAKSLKKSYPKRFTKWTDYVKQASAIYASKHKGKSPIGKKKVIKKVAVKKAAKKKVEKKKIGSKIDSYFVKKELKAKNLKMPHGYTTTKRKRVTGVKPSTHKDTKSHNVNIKVVSGIADKQKAINTLMLMEKDLCDALMFREEYKNTPIVKGSNNINEFKNITQKRWFINKKNSEIKARKKGISEQYKLIKSI